MQNALSPALMTSFVNLHINAAKINTAQIEAALTGVNGATFASVTALTPVKLAAAATKQGVIAYKVARYSVTLCNSEASLYQNAVKREINGDFKAKRSPYQSINGCYSLVELTSNTTRKYLRGNHNATHESHYIMSVDNKPFQIVKKADIAAYMSKKAGENFLNPPKKTVVKHAGIEHSIKPVVFQLENIINLTVNKTVLTSK